EYGLGDDYAARLAVSELVTNAYLAYRESAGGGEPDADHRIDVRVYRDDGEAIIEVRDGAPGEPRIQTPANDGERGRGLFLLDRLLDDLRTVRPPDGTGKIVRATLPGGVGF
ncbi:ATP-binding protein, partial [Actinomadura adrarensis]